MPLVIEYGGGDLGLQRPDLGLQRRATFFADAPRIFGGFAGLDTFGEPPSHFLGAG
jgi:hypothetical protein